MSVTDALHDTLEALYTADTGAGGLNNTASAAYVRAWFRSRDPNCDNRNSTRNWPYVVVNIGANSMNSADCRKYRMGVQMMIYFDRQSMVNDSADTMFSVIDRLRFVFNNKTLSTDTDWSYSTMFVRDEREGPANGVELAQVLEFETYASS